MPTRVSQAGCAILKQGIRTGRFYARMEGMERGEMRGGDGGVGKRQIARKRIRINVGYATQVALSKKLLDSNVEYLRRLLNQELYY